MKPIHSAVLVATLAGACSVMSGGDSGELRRIRASAPSVEWDSASAVEADVTCDGDSDTVVIGYSEDRVWFSVLAAGAAKPQTFSFPVGEQAKDSFCATPVKIEVHPISCIFHDGQGLPGCEEIKGCSGVTLSDGACDAFHFFWSPAQKGLVWWRS